MPGQVVLDAETDRDWSLLDSPLVAVATERAESEAAVAAWKKGLCGALAVLFLARLAGVSEGLDRWLTDAHWRWQAAHDHQPFPSDILVIGIDDASIRALGRLRNWSREVYGRLLYRLVEADAVGLDILVSDADERDPTGDVVFANAVQRQGRTVVAFNQWTEARPLNNRDQQAIRALTARLPQLGPTAAALPMVRHELLQPPFEAVCQTAAALGSVDVTADSDGVYRRAPLARVTDDGRFVPHLAVAMAAIARGVPLDQVAAGLPASLNLRQGQLVPLSEGSLLLQPLARSHSFAAGLGRRVPQMSFHEALTADPARFAHKLVLVGETATGTTDVRANPLDNRLRGVEFNAEILANLLYLEPVRSLPAPLQWLFAALAVGLPLWLFATRAPARATLCSVVGLAVVVAAIEVLFWVGRMMPLWSPVLLGCAGATLVMGLERLVEEQRAKEQIRRSFSLYVAPEVVNEIVANPDLAYMEGDRRGVAVLFSDIRSFTSYCEHNDPEVVVRQMREYLGSMADSVHAHRGVLDKYIGDAVMALWGPFLDDDEPAAAMAVACGLDMLERLAQMNAAWAADGLPTLRIGIGVHFGEAIVGNIGSESRMQYTALGDAVNLASRLESSTKELHATFVVSRELRDAAEAAMSDGVGFRLLDTITVKNREQPVEVYEVAAAGAAGKETGHDT